MFLRALTAVVLGFILVSAPAFAKDGVSAASRIDRKSAAVGDRIKLTLEISAPAGTEVEIPAFKNGLIGEFEIKDSSSRMHKRIFGGKLLRNEYSLASYFVGKKEIPAIEIKYKTRKAKKQETLTTKPLEIEIKSVLPAEMPADIKEIRAPAYFFEVNWFLLAGLFALLSLAAIAAAVYLRNRNRKPVRLPHETALEELEAARAELHRGGDMKTYFVGISDCVRRYIERAFSLKAPEMTTEEFLNSMREASALSAEQKDLLKGFMNACDLVKFARYSPTSAEAENMYTSARNFVEETKGAGPDAVV